jgi:hypothetical protein
MKNSFIILLIFISTILSVSAQNIVLETNEANCGKVDGYVDKDRFAISEKFKVPASSVKFTGTLWRKQSGNMECLFIFDTAIGPVNCYIQKLQSDDRGKTAFASVTLNGSALCFK